MSTARDLVKEDEFRAAFTKALYNTKAVPDFETFVKTNTELASQFKLLALPFAKAAESFSTKSEQPATQRVIAILEELPDPKGGRRKLRLNIQRRGTQRNRGGRKHRKLRKLTTRRR